MLKQLIVLILLSLGVIFGTQHIQPIILLLVSCRDWISQLLLQVFAGGEIGSIIRNLIAMLAMPIALASIPAAVYWLSKRRMFPYFFHCVWVLWLIQTTAIIMLRHFA